MRKAIIGLVLPILAVLLAACGGLAGEPQIVGQVPAQQQSSQTGDVVAPNIEPDLVLGQQIFAKNCVRCHGLTGAGDGEFVQSGQVKDVPDFTNPAQHEGKTAEDYYRQVTQGNLAKLMPPFADSLSDEERWAVANYVFTLADGSSPVTDPHAGLDTASSSGDTTSSDTSSTTGDTTASTEPITAGTGVISGTVTLSTEDATMPDNLVATLHVFDQSMKEQSTELAVNADGSYQFNNVAIDDAHGYYVSVKYNDGVFNSDFLRGDSTTNALTLDVTIYDVIDDSTVIELTSVLTQVDLMPDNTFRIWQMYTWKNNSDKLFALGSAAGHQLSVRVPVPNGATLADGNDTSRYLYDSESGYVYDTAPLLPNQDHSFYLQYTAPATDKWVLNQQFDYIFSGVYQVYADEAQFDLQADGWTATQTQEFQGVTYTGLSTDASAGSLAITIIKKGGGFNFFNLDKQTMGMILTVFGILFIGVALFLFVRGARGGVNPVDSENQIQILMKEIAELDDLYQTQGINEAKYQKQRASLKAKLTKLMKTE